jgi:hypothetical protein
MKVVGSNPTPTTNAKAWRQSRLALRCPGLDPGPRATNDLGKIQPSLIFVRGHVTTLFEGKTYAN